MRNNSVGAVSWLLKDLSTASSQNADTPRDDSAKGWWTIKINQFVIAIKEQILLFERYLSDRIIEIIIVIFVKGVS